MEHIGDNHGDLPVRLALHGDGFHEVDTFVTRPLERDYVKLSLPTTYSTGNDQGGTYKNAELDL